MSTVFHGVKEVIDFIEKGHEDPFFKEKLPAQLRSLDYYIKQIECKELVLIIKRKIVNATRTTLDKLGVSTML